mmetsp:Transcript_17216/g.45513  ORF Transcript_17216/g.45513 Transcript_17216/m.45513 type:complete len:233 (-) Transcript_17216:216-914(-)
MMRRFSGSSVISHWLEPRQISRSAVGTSSSRTRRISSSRGCSLASTACCRALAWLVPASCRAWPTSAPMLRTRSSPMSRIMPSTALACVALRRMASSSAKTSPARVSICTLMFRNPVATAALTRCLSLFLKMSAPTSMMLSVATSCTSASWKRDAAGLPVAPPSPVAPASSWASHSPSSRGLMPMTCWSMFRFGGSCAAAPPLRAHTTARMTHATATAAAAASSSGRRQGTS